MVGAAGRVFLSQSALSLQVKRLEDLLQAPLFLRQGRSLVLTEDGKRLLTYAQELLAINDSAVLAFSGQALSGPVRVGVVQDFADTLLSETLAAFMHHNPAAQVQIRVAGSQELRDMVASDRLDLALYLSAPPCPRAFSEVAMVWLGTGALAERDELPLALLEEPCLFRQAALEALAQAGRTHRIVLETQSLSALYAAVDAGIAMTCRTRLGRQVGVANENWANLPQLPQAALVLDVREPTRPAAGRLSDLIQSAIEPTAQDPDGPSRSVQGGSSDIVDRRLELRKMGL